MSLPLSSLHSLGRPAAGAAATALLALSLTGCQPAADRLSTVSDGTVPAATTSAPAEPADGGQADGGQAASAPTTQTGGGQGSISLAITSPRALKGSASTTVTCYTGYRYRSTSAAVIKDWTVRVNASAIGYTGAGSYPTTLSGSIVSPDRETFAFAGVRTTADLRSSGGSADFSVTGSRGHTLAGSLSWTCS